MFRLLSVAALAGLAVGVSSADDTQLKVKVGDPFPDVPLAAAQIDKVKKGADAVSIADLKGKTVVVFFYPKALTRGCTVESCGFRDVHKEFPAGTVVLGASGDGVALQQQFIDKEKLPYPLLADTELKLVKALGILSPKGAAAQRKTFVVGPDGKVLKVFETVKPDAHPKEVLEFVKGLGK